MTMATAGDATGVNGMSELTLFAYARTICRILDERRSVEPLARRAFDELLALAVRKVDEIAPLNVSCLAFARAEALKVGDLRNRCWFCREMKKEGREKGPHDFHWEHLVPAADLRKEIEQLSESTPEAVAQILSRSKIVWVLAEEDDKLPHFRRIEPERLYREAGIELKYPWAECARRPCSRHVSG